MAKSEKDFRFAVGNTNSRRSNIWKVSVRRNDIYLISRAFGKDYKISLHASGSCRAALTSEYIQREKFSNSNRLLDEWTVKINKGHAFTAFTIRFLFDQLIDFNGIDEIDPSIIKISPPEIGYYVEVIVYKTGIIAESINANVPIGYEILKTFSLQSGEGVVFMYHYSKLLEVDSKQINMILAIAQQAKKNAGIVNRPIAAFFSIKADNGQRGLCELYV